MWETRVRSLGWEDLLEREIAPHSRTLCLENPTDGGAWRATVHGVAKSRTRLSDFTFTFLFIGSKILCLSICPYTSLHSAIHLSVNSKRKEHSSTGDDNLSWHFFLEDNLEKIYADSLKKYGGIEESNMLPLSLKVSFSNALPLEGRLSFNLRGVKSIRI